MPSGRLTPPTTLMIATIAASPAITKQMIAPIHIRFSNCFSEVERVTSKIVAETVFSACNACRSAGKLVCLKRDNGKDHRAGTIDLITNSHAQVRLRVHRIVIRRLVPMDAM